MDITEVRIKLMEDSDDRLQAFCSITFDDCFVVRDLKIIEGANGPFVAMPSRKLTMHCHQCGTKNHLRAAYCNNCGSRLKEDRAARDSEGRCKLYADIAHPINSVCREMIQDRVIAEYRAEIDRSSQPGYVSRYDDDYLADDGPDADFDEPAATSRATRRVDAAEQVESPLHQEAPARADSPAREESSPRSESPPRQESANRAQLQPPERQPRPPHTPAARSDKIANSSSPSRRRGNEGFGAGIF